MADNLDKIPAALKAVNNLSAWKLLAILMTCLLGVLIWKSPEIIRALMAVPVP